MSYRRKKLLALFFAMALSMTAVAGCTGVKSSTGNVVSLETETNAEETSAQSEAGTFSSADMFTERDLAGTYEESGAVYVTLSDDGIAGETDGVVIDGQMVTITAEGTYIFPEHCRKDRLWWMQIMRKCRSYLIMWTLPVLQVQQCM